MLIVLGMLSFMVVSAVAFSIFMRQSRLPSSFLRQRILSRQIVKAGLAHAMSEIDAAIGDDPYPNEWRKSGDGSWKYLAETHGWNNQSQKNYWRHRIFMGYRSGELGGASYYDDQGNLRYRDFTGDDEDKGVPLKQTVSTFPLEGLAYIPPPLVNTVRYWARRTPSASWKNLDYDSGRYAFTAVNVSDYLDINRLKANLMRDSSAEHRISLGYLFEDTSTHAGWGSVKPSKFDETMTTIGSSSFGRLVSLADYNMATGESGPLAGCGFLSQFCKFIQSPPSGAEFYTDENQARIQKFITDSWYPGEAAEEGELILEDSEKPPYRASATGIASIPAGLINLMKNNTVSPVWNQIKRYLNIAERAALKDYVDEDNVPTSLALPTIERTPQLVGLMIKPYGFQPKITELAPQVNNVSETRRETRRVWKMEGFNAAPEAIFQGAALFPFKRSSGLSGTSSYPVQVLVRAYLVEDGRDMSATRAASGDGFAYGPAGSDDWRAVNNLADSTRGYISLFGAGTANVKSSIKTEQDALIDIQQIRLTATDAGSFQPPLFGWVKVEEKGEDGTWSENQAESKYDTSRFGEVGGQRVRFLKENGQLAEAGEGSALKWQFFVWVRILDGNDTVDLFPATMLDDNTYNGVNGDLGPLRQQLGDATRMPLVPIAGSRAFLLDQATFLAGDGHAQGDGDPGETLVAYCNDPRYNWAPEDWWFKEGGSGANANEWYNGVQSVFNGGSGDDRFRQHDLFQFVSNQGYLQSMGEIQFLPLVRRNYSDCAIDNELAGTFFNDRGSNYDGVRRTNPFSGPNKNFYWKTRCAYGEAADHDESEQHCAYEWGVRDRRGGVTVSPYADKDLLMAALANTPYDYIVAAEQDPSQKDAGSLENNIDLCFNARSSEAKLTWDQLSQIAEKIQTDILSKGSDWEEEWEESDEWDEENFFGQSIPNFHDVDRKFLFSYWKQCFGNNQQLFLVFVRAEPTVIGGSSAGHTPSQLGARAVALVWRDPTGIASSVGAGNTGGQKVHKMRVLFYHQFE